jgi:hypothetical protein
VTRRRWRERAVRTASLFAGIGLITAALSGCSSPHDALEQSVSDASSAVGSAAIAMTQQSEDRTFVTTTQTALSDAVTAITDAESSAAQAAASTPREVALQKRSLSAIRAGLDAVLAAQRVVDTDASAGLPELRKQAGELSTLTKTLESGS